MEKIDLSTNSKKINELYSKIVRGDESTTYGVFSVDKSGVLDASASGADDLHAFVDEFTDGQVQFGMARVTVPGSDVSKNILLGWCPDNAPAKLRLSFAANFADVARVFSGYHIQITARDTDDLDVDEMLSRVGAAAGARYTFHSSGAATPAKKTSPIKPAVKPTPAKPTPAKPASFVPKTTGKPVAAAVKPPVAAKPPVAKPAAVPSSADDGWGDEKAIEERDFETQPLEDVPSAYKPTKVNIAELRSQKSDTISSQPKATPKPVAAAEESAEPQSLGDRMKSYQNNDDGRLTSLPKPKVSHSVGSRWTPPASAPTFGSKPQFGLKPPLVAGTSAKKLPEGVFQNHANENGLTPAQAWALKRGKYNAEASPAAETNVNDAVAKLSVGDEESEPESEAEPSTSEPQIIKPSFGAPPKRNVPAVAPTEEEPEKVNIPQPPNRVIIPLPSRSEPAPEESDEEVLEEEEPAPAPAPVLPTRAAAPEPTPAPVLPTRAAAPEPAPAKKEGATAVAQYDYEKDEDNEIGFEEGDLIVEIEFVDEEWWSGKNSRTQEVGVFPGSYVALNNSEASAADEPGEEPQAPVEETVEETPASAAPVTAGKTAVAEYDYEKEEDNEIGFAEGDLIVEIEFVDENWWSGKHSVTGEVGVFPGNFVSLQ